MLTAEYLDNWYAEHASDAHSLQLKVVDLLGEILAAEGLTVVLSGRVKTQESFVEKCVRKRYANARQVGDLVGVRVVAATLSEAHAAADLVESLFESVREDKAAALGANEVGYLSIHLQCRLSSQRAVLPEWAGLAHLPFEVQVRTKLQHAWAEFEHDRGYKSAAQLPKEIRREVQLLAALLEVADRQFDDLARRITTFAEHLEQENARAEELTWLKVQMILAKRFDFRYSPSEEGVKYLRKLGVKTVGAFIDLVNRTLARHGLPPSLQGQDCDADELIRTATILANPEQAISSRLRNWSKISHDDVDWFNERTDVDLNPLLTEQDVRFVNS